MHEMAHIIDLDALTRPAHSAEHQPSFALHIPSHQSAYLSLFHSAEEQFLLPISDELAFLHLFWLSQGGRDLAQTAGTASSARERSGAHAETASREEKSASAV